MKVTITSKGAIVVDDFICIDGHDNNCRYRFVTHIHQDHILGLDQSIVKCKKIVGTSITLELLEILGYNIPKNRRLDLDYDKEYSLDEYKVKLLYSHHIPGTAQIVIEHNNGIFGYTSDFKSPLTKTPIIHNPDILVIDSTYGDPRYKRPSEEEILHALTQIINTSLTQKPVMIYAYYGKAQEIMKLLRETGIDAPYILSYSQWQVYRVLNKYGFQVSDVYLDGSTEAEEIKRDRWFIYITHFSKRLEYLKMKNYIHIVLSGWLTNAIVKKVSDRYLIVNFSDHADFYELIEYLKVSKPKLVVLDSYRSRENARIFAKYVSDLLGLKTVVLP